MEPIGTIRREDHEGGGHSIWIRQDPGYPDREFRDTEWTCLWSTSAGNIGIRHGVDIDTCSHIIGAAPGSPAETGEDVAVGDRVETLPGALYWTDEPLLGRIAEIQGYSANTGAAPYFKVLFDEPQSVDGEFPTTYTRWALHRLSFTLEEDFE